MKNLKETKFYNAKSVTVFDSVGTGRKAKSSPSTYNNVLVEIEGTTACIYNLTNYYVARLDVITKKTTSKYWKIEAREIKKRTFNQKLNALRKEVETLNAKSELVREQEKQAALEQSRNDYLEAVSRAESKRETIINLLPTLKNCNKQQWNERANKIVGLIGYDLCKTVGWKTLLNIAKNI